MLNVVLTLCYIMSSDIVASGQGSRGSQFIATFSDKLTTNGHNLVNIIVEWK